MRTSLQNSSSGDANTASFALESASPLSYWVHLIQEQKKQQMAQTLWCSHSNCGLKHRQHAEQQQQPTITSEDMQTTTTIVMMDMESPTEESNSSGSSCCRWKQACLRRWVSNKMTNDFLTRFREKIVPIVSAINTCLLGQSKGSKRWLELLGGIPASE